MKNIKNYFLVVPTQGKLDKQEGERQKIKRIRLNDEQSSDILTEESKSSSGSEETGVVSATEHLEVTTLPSQLSLPNQLLASSEIPIADWPPMDTMEVSWRQRLYKEHNKPYFQRLLAFLATEARNNTVYPPSLQIFTALNLCPYDNVKVVIIGQDPYHGPDQAHGLAFSVQKGVPLPPSLKNIISELQSDPKIKIHSPSHGNLESWSRQGVLLLNTVLTVRKNEANSHQKKG